MKKSASKTKALPHGYLSWSQLDLLERDPGEYARHYILNEPRFESEAMMFGGDFADAMETGTIPERHDSAFRFLVEIGIPRLEIPECKIEATHKGINLLGKIDSASPDLSRFREYKTGRLEWTQSRVDKHGQLTFYALIIFIKTGKIPKECHLDWIRTEYDEQTGEIRAKGDFKTFKRRPFTLLEVLNMTKRIEKAYETITELMTEHGGVQPRRTSIST